MFVEPIKDHTIKIKPTTRLIEFVAKQVKKKDDVPQNIIALKSYGKRQQIFLTLNDVKWLNSYLQKYRESSNDKVYLHELLESANICLPTPPVKPKNPELVARLKKLEAQQSARDYASMTKSVNPYKKTFPEDSIAAQIKEMNKQLIAVAQFVLSVMAGFAFGFIGVELIVGDLDFGFRLLLGIMISLIIALAEIYFLAKKLSEDVYDYPESTSRKVHQD